MVSIITLNYHVKKELFACLSSIYESKPKTKFEIIVVDNDEKKTIEKELKKQFPKVKYVKNENKGFGQGNNVGTKHAKGEYLFFLNPDTLVSKGAIDTLVSYLHTHKKVGIVAPLLYNMDGSIVPLQGARELTPLRAVFSFSFINKFFPKNPITKQYWYFDEWNKKSIKHVESIPGTAFIIRRGIYEEINGFDEKFFLYFEEQDLCKRVKQLGWDIIMHPQAKIFHALGSSTKQMKRDVSKIFRQSRFYYLKKHFGLLKALGSEMVLRTNKYVLLLLFFVGVGAYLRLIDIGASMAFIGDQGWFYLSARDMLLKGDFPLVGIVSSHPWLHQGAFWTYLLGLGFWVFGFKPFIGEYISVVLDLIAIVLIYKFGSEMFSRRLGVIAAALYTTSPLVILNARMPYHTSPIPLVTIFSLYCLFKWVKGNIYYFPLLVGSLAVLYNLEIATFLFSIAVMAIWLYGYISKKQWAKKVFDKKILFLTIGGWLVIMLPMLLYDVGHGFSQTVKFLVWIGYRILVVLGYPAINPMTPVSFPDMIHFVTAGLQRLIFLNHGFVALALFVTSVYVLLLKIIKQKNKLPYILLGIVNLFLIVGLFVAKTPSGAYLPLLFPGIILMIAVAFDSLVGSKQRLIRLLGVVVIMLLTFFNGYAAFQANAQDDSFIRRLDIAKYIVKESFEKEYNLNAQGPSSQFESFTMNYEYLVWWLGHGPSDKEQKLRFTISEVNGKIQVVKELKSLDSVTTLDRFEK